jgi:Nucleoside recognition.
MPSKGKRALRAIREVLPSAAKTAWWLIRITVTVSLIIVLLRYTGILYWISDALSPVFKVVGLPGEAALAFITGYFVNVYSAIAVMVTLDMDIRAITILSVMVLCAHNMITETAVQKKTGSSVWRILLTRSLSAFVLGVALNLVMPGEVVRIDTSVAVTKEALWPMLEAWGISTIYLIAKMVALIFGLSILQRLLSEFGVIHWISRFLKPIMLFFGLPAKTAFLWIVANTLGLAYGAAIMVEETERGTISRKDVDLLNHHIGISHSNLEDLLLLVSVGGLLWWLLLSRWCMSLILVWERRLEYHLGWVRNIPAA